MIPYHVRIHGFVFPYTVLFFSFCYMSYIYTHIHMSYVRACILYMCCACVYICMQIVEDTPPPTPHVLSPQLNGQSTVTEVCCGASEVSELLSKSGRSRGYASLFRTRQEGGGWTLTRTAGRPPATAKRMPIYMHKCGHVHMHIRMLIAITIIIITIILIIIIIILLIIIIIILVVVVIIITYMYIYMYI